MSSIPGVVAVNTFREAVRDRVLYNLIFFALLMIGSAILVGQISIGIDRMVIINLGLSAISLIGLIMAIFIGVGLVSKEIEKRTLYSLLAKPIRRWEFIAGKYAGLLLTLTVNTGFMAVGLAAALFYVGRPFVGGDATIVVAIYFILLELALVTALALFFSCFSSPILSTLFTLGIYVTGVFARDIRNFGDLTENSLIEILTRAVYYAVPNFHNFNAIAAAAHGDRVPLSLIGLNTVYTAVYATLVLVGGVRDILQAEFEMTAGRKNGVLRVALAVMPALFVASAFLQTRIDAQTQGLAAQSEDLLLQSPTAVKRLSLGYDPLLADIYWTRTVQYYGKNVGTAKPDFTLLWPLLDLATTLDPKLVVAYHFGAIFLSEPGNVGAGRTDLAVQLVKRGVESNPNNWQLGTDLGFLYYWRMKDYHDAAEAYLRASKIPNAPPWIRLMAARIAQTGGSLETSQLIWTQIYSSTPDPSVKKLAYEQLQGLRARLDMAHLDAIAESFKQHVGRYPSSSAEMRDAGFLTGIPVDPAGYKYEIDPDGKASLNSHTTFVLPSEPKKLFAPAE